MGALCALDQKTLLDLEEILHVKKNEFDSMDILIGKCKAKLRQGKNWDQLRQERACDFVREVLQEAKRVRIAKKRLVVADQV